MLFTKFGADCACAKIINAYNNLKHFVMGEGNELEKAILNLTSRNKSNFQIYFRADPNKYIKDLNEKVALVKKGNYDKTDLTKYLENKIIEVDSLPYL